MNKKQKNILIETERKDALRKIRNELIKAHLEYETKLTIIYFMINNLMKK